jgi:hypothetical protein
LKGLLNHQNIFETSGSQKGPLGSRSKISLEEFCFRSVDITLPGSVFKDLFSNFLHLVLDFWNGTEEKKPSPEVHGSINFYS